MAKANRKPARAPAPVNPKAKALKISIDAANYTGYEPEWAGVEITDENRQRNLMKAFNWYNYNFGSKDSKAFVLEYLKLAKRTADMKGFKKAHDNTLTNAYGWMARMTLMGWVMSEQEQARFDAAVSTAITESANNADDEDSADVTTAKKFNIQERMREKAAEAGGEVEGMIDDYIAQGAKAKHNFQPINVLKVANILPGHVPSEVLHWEKVKAEFVEAHKGKDSDLKEGYGHLTKIQLRNIVKFIDLIIADYHGYVGFKKASKAPRKRKVKTPAQLVVKLKYQKKDDDLKLESVAPSKIIGATEMFAYNTKKRKLMYFVADAHAGNELTVKNNTIEGYDVVKSVQKTIRKPAEQLKAFMSASLPNTRKLFAKTKATETKLSGRFTPEVIILKVK